MENASSSIRDWLKHSAFLRVIFISFVVLLLQIPIGMIDSQVNERQVTKNQAVKDVTSKWGYAQHIKGPRLVVPYHEITTWKDRDGEVRKNRIKRFVTFLPETLNIQANVESEIRYRGIFEIPLYKTQLRLVGQFKKPDFSRWGIDPKLILWKHAELIVGVTDPRGIRKQAFVKWGSREIALEPGMGKSGHNESGFHVLLKEGFDEASYDYQIDLALNGNEHLYFSPMAKETAIKLESDWPDPSFQGYKLPTSRTISATGFNADWNISSISRSYPQAWLHHDFDTNKLNSARVGVDFISPVDNYRMTERSIKYVMLFLLLTFVSIWLIEVIAKVRVHLLQYLLVGLGMCLFYLLLLAFSEHIGFVWAYIVSSLAVIMMTALYSRVVLKTGKRALIVGTGITALYIYLYTLLQEQNYSLLFGSIGVFGVLAGVMYVTRNIDWYALGKE